MSDHIKFVRIRGRVVPIKSKKTKSKKDVSGLALGIGGAALSIVGATAISKLFKSRKFKIASLIGTVFAGEAIAAEGIDRFTESLDLSKRKEQNIKNVAGGTLGVLGALSAIRGLR